MELDDPCICGRLRRASRVLARRYDEALAPLGLAIGQFSLLRTLARMGQPTLTAFAEATAHEKSALWRLVQPMIRRGWIVAETRSGERGQRLDLTPEGRALLAEALPLWRDAQDRIRRSLGSREAELIALLHQVETHV